MQIYNCYRSPVAGNEKVRIIFFFFEKRIYVPVKTGEEMSTDDRIKWKRPELDGQGVEAEINLFTVNWKTNVMDSSPDGSTVGHWYQQAGQHTPRTPQ